MWRPNIASTSTVLYHNLPLAVLPVANRSKLNIPAVTLLRPSAACDRNTADGRDQGNLQLRFDL
jgi:hypothetical protein